MAFSGRGGLGVRRKSESDGTGAGFQLGSQAVIPGETVGRAERCDLEVTRVLGGQGATLKPGKLAPWLRWAHQERGCL